MIEFVLDGRTVQAREDQTVLQAARQNGVRIPHLCYHPALKPSGSCRVCGVEVVSSSGKPAVVLSCVIKVKPGLVVRTDTDQVRAHREKAFNRLLQMAPDAVRIRNLAREMGVSVSPRPDGCIQCGLCVRVCAEIVKAGALKMVKDGRINRVTVIPGRCIGCGTCANLCPTDLIRIRDLDNVRTISIKDDVVGELPLERCEGCGNLYATEIFLRHVEESMPRHPDTKEHHHLCPACIKLLSGRAVTEMEKIRK